MSFIPQPIATAPRDRVILTDCGTACYVDQREWGSPVTNGWYLCDTSGNISTCADHGMSVSGIDPELWMPLPDFKNPVKVLPENHVAVPVEGLKAVHRDLDACRVMMWQAGVGDRGYGFDPTYCSDAQARLNDITGWLNSASQDDSTVGKSGHYSDQEWINRGCPKED